MTEKQLFEQYAQFAVAEPSPIIATAYALKAGVHYADMTESGWEPINQRLLNNDDLRKAFLAGYREQRDDSAAFEAWIKGEIVIPRMP